MKATELIEKFERKQADNGRPCIVDRAAGFREQFPEFAADLENVNPAKWLIMYDYDGPALGQVSTYRGWLKQGRQVTKGQHGLKILAPRMAPDENGKPKIDGLRLVTLFDISQTEELVKEGA